MNNPPARRIRRQRLGLRLGLELYYTIVEQTPTRLRLESRPGANARAGHTFMGCGGAIALITPLLILSLFIAGTQSIGDVVFGVLLSWPFAVIGLMGWTSGRAIATTHNSITIDRDADTIVYEQQNQVSRKRSQTLHIDQIVAVRLRLRSFTPPGLFRRPRKIVALEMVTDEEFIWLVDSTIEREAILPTAQAVSDVLGIELTIV